jgi:hypothetical protein
MIEFFKRSKRLLDSWHNGSWSYAMSYDLYLLYVPDGYTFDDAYDGMDDGTLPVINMSQNDKDARNWLIFKALLDKDTELQIAPQNTADLFKQVKSNPNQNLPRFPGTAELSNEEGISIDIYEDAVCISVPYWYSGSDGRAVFEKIRKYLKVVQKHSNYSICDSQVNKIVDPDADLQAMLKAYDSTYVRFHGDFTED